MCSSRGVQLCELETLLDVQPASAANLLALVNVSRLRAIPTHGSAFSNKMHLMVWSQSRYISDFKTCRVCLIRSQGVIYRRTLTDFVLVPLGAREEVAKRDFWPLVASSSVTLSACIGT